MADRIIVLGVPSAYFAKRETGWSLLPAGPRGEEISTGADVLTDAVCSATLGRPARIEGDAIRLDGAS